MKAETALARLSGGSITGPKMPGGVPVITEAEIQGAMGGLSDLQRNILMLSWCGDRSSFHPALRAALVVFSDDERIQSWRQKRNGHKPGLLQAFIAVSLAEVSMPEMCRKCQGTGTVAASDCPRCEGSGRKAMPQREKVAIASNYVRMSQPTWSRYTREYDYGYVYQKIKDAHDDGLRRIKRQLVA